MYHASLATIVGILLGGSSLYMFVMEMEDIQSGKVPREMVVANTIAAVIWLILALLGVGVMVDNILPFLAHMV